MSDTGTGTETAEDTQAAPDPKRQPVLDALRAELGELLVGSELAGDDLWVRVERSAWKHTLEVCRRLGFDYFCFLAGLDWLPAPELSGEKTFEPAEGAAPTDDDEDGDDLGLEDEVEEDTGPVEQTSGVAGGDTRFQVFARLHSTTRGVGITLKADLDDVAPEVESVTTVYPGADWHERETWEMYGFEFVGHPGLRHLYLPGAFEGHPQRKDFPLLAREVKPWPGLVDVEPIPAAPVAGEAAPAEAEA